LPIHPTLGQDWDTAPTAIDWPRLRAFLRTVKRIARIPDDHSSHDHLNEQKHVTLDDAVAARCKAEIAAVQEEVEAASGARVVWALVDGFLLYWDQVRAYIYICLSTSWDSELTCNLFCNCFSRKLLILSMLGYFFGCRATYSRSGGRSDRDMLLPVGCLHDGTTASSPYPSRSSFPQTPTTAAHPILSLENK
jgi:hypothetical protein